MKQLLFKDLKEMKHGLIQNKSTMKRLLFQDLLDWRDSPNHQPVILRGARQVGKTHLVRQLGEKFESFIEVNFERNPELAKIFEHDLDPVRISRELSLVTGKTITPGKTLLFLDEIQVAHRSILALRYFYEEIPNLHVIAAGSLVDFAIDQVGVPVGRVIFLYMYPLSFIEFLYARGYQSLAIEIIQHEPSKIMSEAIHDKALRLLGEYTAIGGMPKAVYHWVTAQDIKSCTSVLHNINNAYEQDFEKYAKKKQIKYVDLLFKQIPTQICQPLKYSNLNTDHRKRELEPALHLLEKAGILHQVIHSHGNGIPLGAEINSNKFKLIMLDIGLCQSLLGLDLTAAFINKGKISESFIGQELLAYSDPTGRQTLYYWHREKRGSNAEVDYLITHNQNVIPVEVKSGDGGGLQSMRIFLKSHPDSLYGIRFSTHNYSVFDHIHSYPLYALAGAINNKERLLRFLRTEKE